MAPLPAGFAYVPMGGEETVECGETGGEPRVVLFPLAYSTAPLTKVDSLRTHDRPQQQLQSPELDRHLEFSNNEEIAILQRRLQMIKERRRKQHTKTCEYAGNEQDRTLRDQQSVANGKWANNTSNSQLLTARRASLSSETAEETIDTTFTSSGSSMLNPKRLLCSTYKAKNITQDSSSASRPPRQKMKRAPDSTKTQELDAIVCMSGPRQPSDDRLDLIVCAGRKTNENLRYATLEGKAPSFDPYDSAPRGGPCHSPSRGLEYVVPRQRAFSDLGTEDTSRYHDAEQRIAVWSCIPSKPTPWFVRQDCIETVPDIDLRMMEMVYFPNEGEV